MVQLAAKFSFLLFSGMLKRKELKDMPLAYGMLSEGILCINALVMVLNANTLKAKVLNNGQHTKRKNIL